MNMQYRLKSWSRSNWFFVVAPLLLAMGALIGRNAAWGGDGQNLEAALLFDTCVTLPVLYALCYCRALPIWQLAVRMAGVACLGIYLLSFIVPPGSQILLPNFNLARTIGLGLLILFELRLIVVAVRMTFSGKASVEQIAEKTGAPPIIAKLMLIEARFWKAVWRLLRRGD